MDEKWTIHQKLRGYENSEYLVTPCKYWSHPPESNRRPTHYESDLREIPSSSAKIRSTSPAFVSHYAV